jgi:hypothetical protein
VIRFPDDPSGHRITSPRGGACGSTHLSEADFRVAKQSLGNRIIAPDLDRFGVLGIAIGEPWALRR